MSNDAIFGIRALEDGFDTDHNGAPRALSVRMESEPGSSILTEHDLFRKPVSTLRVHAPTRTIRTSPISSHGGRRTLVSPQKKTGPLRARFSSSAWGRRRHLPEGNSCLHLDCLSGRMAATGAVRSEERRVGKECR